MVDESKADGDATTVPDHPWLATYPAEVDWAAPLSQTGLPDLFDAAVAKFGPRPCIDFLGKTYSYAEIAGLVARAAKGFQALGVGKGTRVGLCLPNTPYAVICYFAILRAGGTVVNFNPLYAPRELVHQIEDSGTHIMVTLDIAEIFDKVHGLLHESGLGRIVVCPMTGILPGVKKVLFSLLKRGDLARVPADDRHVPFARLIDNDGAPAPVAIDPAEDLAVLQYTGGTTGVPKGAMLTHANLTANTDQVRHWFVGMRPGEESLLGVLPLFHVFAMTTVMNFGISIGAELILLPRFELKRLLETVASRKPTLFPAVPTIFNAISTAPETARFDLSSIKYCISGGAPLPVEVKRSFEKLTGCVVVEGYGLTESSPVAVCNPLTGANKAGSIGIPLPGTVVEIRNLEDRCKRMPQGERGEVCLVGPQVMKGYWRKPDETADTIVDGRLHTGDVGYMDEDGYTFLVDRIKDLILSGGYNVYPRNIEEAIYLHPSVAETVVIGIPDDYRGQSAKAFVTLRPGEELTEADLMEFLDDKLSPIEMPAEIEFRDELPKTMIGKLSKKELVEEEAAKRGGA